MVASRRRSAGPLLAVLLLVLLAVGAVLLQRDDAGAGARLRPCASAPAGAPATAGPACR